jgi:hypothetical protein
MPDAEFVSVPLQVCDNRHGFIYLWKDSLSIRSDSSQSSLSASTRVLSGLALVVCLWAIGLIFGIRALWAYETTPGIPAMPHEAWPANVSLVRDNHRATLVMMVHPNCPCSRASVGELEMLMSHRPNLLDAYVVFERMAGMAEDPATSDLWKSAARIPGVKIIDDAQGALPAKFHAQTSGQVFLYDASGSLRFSGGITESRGHAGENEGRTAIEAILNAQTPKLTRTPVFGCSLK